MSLNSIIRIFLPKDKVFYDYFEKISTELCLLIGLLKQLAHTTDKAEQKRLFLEIEKGESRNDDLTHRIFVELGKNFITPFDREDIHYLATSLDDIADFIYASAKKITRYNIDHIDDHMKEFIQLSENAILELQQAILSLRGLKSIEKTKSKLVNINKIENQADEVLDKAILELFGGSFSPIDIIKLKEIYQDLEIISDKCEEASFVIESILIKYS